MPAKKTSRSTTSRNRKTSSLRPRSATYMNSMQSEDVSTDQAPQKSRLSPLILAIPFIIAILVLILWKNKSWLVAATVNGQPIWRWNLEQRFVARYGTQTLDEMINEQILKSEAAKQGVKVTDTDVNNKITQIEKTLQGKITLKDALAQQGMTMDEFRNQVELQVLIEKLTANKVTVSDKEIADYIAANKDTMVATESAALQQEARTAILEQKRNQTFQSYFANLKKNAKIAKYL